MSGPKRTTLSRPRKEPITGEMVELYRRGREIQKARADETWEEEGGRRREFLDIMKRLDISLLGRGWHEASMFADLSGPSPNPDSHGWVSGRELQEQLQAALDARTGR
jgi:hypothetical protein